METGSGGTNLPFLIDTQQVESKQEQTGAGNTFYYSRADLLCNHGADIAADDRCWKHNQKKNQVKVAKLHMADTSHGRTEEDSQ